MPSDLLHPGVRLALGRLIKDELPCEIDSLLLCDVEVNDEDSRGMNTTPLLRREHKLENTRILKY